jgi:hypothetical protein
MKKRLLFSVIVIFTLPAFSQNFPIDTLNANWIERNEHGEGKDLTIEYFRYYVDGDTIFNDQKFFKLYKEQDSRNAKYMGAFKEVEGKVYYKGEDYWMFPTDSVVLLYDFTAEIDDTVHTGSWQAHIIQDIDSVMIDGQLRKRLHTWDQVWIEGIGCINGFFYPISEIPIAYWKVWISCYYIEDEMIYQNPAFYNCYTLVGTDDIESENKWLFTPNPVQKGGIIRVKSVDSYSAINLFDLSGQRIKFHKKVVGDYIEISTNSLSRGLYIIQIENSKARYARKVIIE